MVEVTSTTEKVFTKGDLIHLPSNVFLRHKIAGRWKYTEKPTTGMFLEVVDEHLSKIFIDGEEWYVESTDIY